MPLQLAGSDRAEVRRLAQRRDLRRALHVVDENGAWASGGEAMLRAMERLPSMRRYARVMRLRPFAMAVAPAYRLIAGNRDRLAWLAGSFGSTQRVRRAQSCRTHGRVETGDGTDGQRGEHAPNDSHGRHDRLPILR